MDDSDELDATADRRLFEESAGSRFALVASELGVARLSISGDRVGRASLLERCTATSVATDSERVLAGTTGGVLAGPGLDRLGEPFEVAAVGVGSQLLAAGNDGVVSVWEGVDGWNAVGSVDAPARFDGPLLAAEDGVYRVTSGCEPLGLDRVADVAHGEESFAATADGLYRRVEGDWALEHDHPTVAVSTGGGGVCAVDDRGVVERTDGVWQRSESPTSLVDIATDGDVYAITENGTLLAAVDPDRASDGQSGWRTHAVGLRGVVELALG